MFKPAYKIKIGSLDIDSAKSGSTGDVKGIFTNAGMTASTGAATIGLTQTKKQNIKKNDPVSVEMGYGDQTTTVMKGAAVNIKPSFETITIIAHTPVQKLLDLRLNQTYENQSAGDIVSDLAGQVNIDTQTVENGIKFPFYVIDHQKNCWEHLHDIAEKCGFDLYLTPDSKLIFKPFKKSSAAHTLIYGKDIISLKHFDAEADFKNVEVRGESPGSSQGSNTSHWLTKSFENFKGSTGTKAPVLSIQDAVIRTKEAADASAIGRMNIIQRKKHQGMVDIIGNANIKLGDIFEIKQAPQNYLNGLFQVREVSHTLNKETGFKTRIHFWGMG